MNEKLRILKLLEDGKINADEAARLLEAVNQSEAKERKGHFWSHIETIPHMVSSAIASSFKDMHSDEHIEIPKKQKITVKGISGDIEIMGADTDRIGIDKDGFAKISEDDDELEIKAISGNITITAPTNTDFTMKGVSGDLNMADLKGRIEIKSVSGNIIGKHLSGSMVGNFVSGDAELDYKEVDEINITSQTGDLILKLDENIEAEVLLITENGDIDCEFALKDERKSENSLKGIINNPKAKIEIKTEHGDIVIKKRRS